MQVLVSRIGKERLYSRGGREPHRGLVSGTRSPGRGPARCAAASTTTSSRRRRRGLQLHRDRRRPAEGRGRRLEGPPGPHAGRRGVPPELVDQQIEALRFAVAELAPVERPAQAGDTVVVDLVQPTAARRSATTSSRSARAACSRRSRRGSSACPPARRSRSRYELAEGADEHGRGHAQGREGEDPAAARRRPRPRGERVRHARRAARRHRAADRRADRGGGRVRSSGPPRPTRSSTRRTSSLPARSSRRARASSSPASSSRSNAAGSRPRPTWPCPTRRPQQLEERLRAEATRSVARELALEAVADKAGIEVTDDELREFIREHAEARRARPPTKSSSASSRAAATSCSARTCGCARRSTSSSPRSSASRSSSPRAREKLWTPEKGAAAPETKLWTPGSKEPAYEPVDPDGDRADLARRACVRHLLAPAERAHHLPRHARSTTRSRT